MPSSSGPKLLAKDSLVYAMDTYDTGNCVTPLGCGGFNSSTQGIKNIVTGTTALFQNGLRISNRDFYTAFAIDYPEGSYGGDAANRQGITPGYNVRSGGKIFGYGRALHHSIWNDDSQSWVVHNTYDTYAYTSEVDAFVNNYNSYKITYPNAVHVVAGSHRDSNHNSNQYTILRDLGAPSNVDSIIGFSSPEWILVGKPGLGAGNAYGWVFQNYPTNPDYVAHMNFSVAPKALGILEFDGSDDNLDLGVNAYNLGIRRSATFMGWMKPLGTGGAYLLSDWNGVGMTIRFDGTTGVTFYVYGSNRRINPSYTSVPGTWYHLAGVMDDYYMYLYVNGTSVGSAVLSEDIGNSPSTLKIAARGDGGSHYQQSANLAIYNRAFSQAEVLQVYNQQKIRFGY